MTSRSAFRRQLLDAFPGSWVIDTGRHPKLVVTVGNRTLRYTIPGSPSDSRRGARNAIADIRRQLRTTKEPV